MGLCGELASRLPHWLIVTKKIWKAFITIALVLALLLIAAEFGLRWAISDQMKKEFASSTGQAQEEPSIKFGPTPVLLSQLTGVIPSVEMRTPATYTIADGPNGAPSIVGDPASHVMISDLNISDRNNPIAGHLEAETELPEDFLLAQAQAGVANQKAASGNDLTSQLINGLVKITKFDAVAAENAVKVEFSNGAATLTLRPIATNGGLIFEAEQANLLGLDLPSSITETISKALAKQADQAASDLSVDEVVVEEYGVRLRFSGDDVPLSSLEEQQRAHTR